MSSTVRIRDIDRGGRRFRAAVEELAKGTRVTVGVHEDVGAVEHRGSSSATVVEVAAGHEFGASPGAEPRSWLRAMIDEQGPRIERALSAAARRALKSAQHGSSASGHVDRAFGRVAARFAKAAQRRIRRLGLIDTRHLLESVEGRVNGKTARAGEAGGE